MNLPEAVGYIMGSLLQGVGRCLELDLILSSALIQSLECLFKHYRC